jgi:hypothetical protein
LEIHHGVTLRFLRAGGGHRGGGVFGGERTCVYLWGAWCAVVRAFVGGVAFSE